MAQQRQSESSGSERPEIFWILFVLISAGAFLAVAEPARRETAEAERRLAASRAELAAMRRRIEILRRERRALEEGDLEAWRAAAAAAGVPFPGDPESPGVAQVRRADGR